MLIKETSVFTRQVQKLLDEESYRDDLSPEQRTILKRIVEEEFHG